ncbi:ESX secretion-associated protein EspG [Nocardia sp. NPDC049149]|uniref:ESX secretion-associated protein EspG n=1 Tax=Nocardia sp. NPDC049149 TaxID=3364315 RepID=UPI0037148649
MTQTWTFTDDEFDALWERYANTHLPAPFMYTSRARRLDDYERQAFQAWDRLRRTLDSSFHEVLETFLRPEVSVIGYGWNEQDMDNPEKRTRVRAVRAGSRGYLMTQLPGETIWHSGGFIITDCGPHGISDAVLAALPQSAKAGRLRNIPIVINRNDDGGEYQHPGSVALDNTKDTSVERSQRFLDIPATSTGAITIHQGRSKFGPRGIMQEILMWRDLPGDGRYVIKVDSAPVAMGVGPDRLRDMVDEAIERILERMDTHWEPDRLPQRGRW